MFAEFELQSILQLCLLSYLLNMKKIFIALLLLAIAIACDKEEIDTYPQVPSTPVVEKSIKEQIFGTWYCGYRESPHYEEAIPETEFRFSETGDILIIEKTEDWRGTRFLKYYGNWETDKKEFVVDAKHSATSYVRTKRYRFTLTSYQFRLKDEEGFTVELKRSK